MRPVFELVLQEVRDRHNVTAPVPHPQHNICRVDFLNPAPVTIDDDEIFHTNGLGHGNLHACNQIGQQATRRKTHNQ